MKKILITGGTGLIGKRLISRLLERKYEVAILSRNNIEIDNVKTYIWNVDKDEIDIDAFKDVHCVIHLAGANIGDKRWTKKRKQILADSRIKSGLLIFERFRQLNNSLAVFISASATGYYGTKASPKIYVESDDHADDYLANLCFVWEQMADRFGELGARVVKVRTGIVLTNQGGVLPKFVKLIRAGLGAAIGSGKQYMPWIHIDDLCDIYIKAIEDSMMNGAYNAVAPNNITNTDLMKCLAQTLNRRIWLPNIPAVFIKTFFGKMADIILLGNKISSDKIINAGFEFKYTNIKNALDGILNQYKIT